ncbi:PAC2 family protein [Dietzia timorensis]|uniref:PAC2 family protein n=1 Tax=Dietzia timorensis TaxID=499555 RepID=A0A173LPD4_9ACTN|nr:PAC2 family protein [Dietzia timorensis]ANI92420.1 Hypothetical protein BJL86_1643 [Dietzia timorensis]
MSLAWNDEETPSITAPIMVIALEGWSDAGDAATQGLEQLALEWDTTGIAKIADEVYFPYGQVRPTVELVDGVVRSLSVPSIDIFAASPPDSENEVLLVLGPEPASHWQAFTMDLLTLADTFGVREVYILGSISADVPHTRQTPLSGASYSKRRLQEVGLEPGNFHGPAGLPLVLQEAFTREGVPATTAFAAVPHYVAGNSAPAATLRLLTWLSSVTELDMPTLALEGRVEEWRQQVDSATEADDDLQGYVHELEEQFDSVEDTSVSIEVRRTPQERIRLVDGDQLAAEFEHYLQTGGKDEGRRGGGPPTEFGPDSDGGTPGRSDDG